MTAAAAGRKCRPRSVAVRFGGGAAETWSVTPAGSSAVRFGVFSVAVIIMQTPKEESVVVPAVGRAGAKVISNDRATKPCLVFEVSLKKRCFHCQHA